MVVEAVVVEAVVVVVTRVAMAVVVVVGAATTATAKVLWEVESHPGCPQCHYLEPATMGTTTEECRLL